jgi:hypothetical protein
MQACVLSWRLRHEKYVLVMVVLVVHCGVTLYMRSDRSIVPSAPNLLLECRRFIPIPSGRLQDRFDIFSFDMGITCFLICRS